MDNIDKEKVRISIKDAVKSCYTKGWIDREKGKNWDPMNSSEVCDLIKFIMDLMEVNEKIYTSINK